MGHDAEEGSPLTDVVVTGIGAVTPVGLSAPDTWRALLAGKSGIDTVRSFDASDLPVRIAGEVRDFDPTHVMTRKSARRAARFAQLAVAAAREAVDDARLSTGVDPALDTGSDARLDTVANTGGTPVDPARIGAVINTAVAGVPETQDNVQRLLDSGPRAVSPYYVSSVIPNMAACEVAIALGLRGPVTAGALACASGNAALLDAQRLLDSGEADVVVAGGSDAGIAPVMLAGLSNMGPLSQRNDEPEKASRPFDLDRDGFVFGEGAVCMVLERAEDARARGATPYAVLAGGALTCDAFHVTAPEPTAAVTTETLRLSLDRTGLGPTDIDYIAAHGTATKANDRTEALAIRKAFGDAADEVAVSSPKSMVGHLIGAAGALSAMVCAYAIRDGLVPPTINLESPDPECDLDHVPLQARQQRVDAALANAFGFGGQNCVVALRRP